MRGVAESEAERGETADLRRAGRALLIALHGAARKMKLYPLEHAAVQRGLADLAAVAEEMCSVHGELALSISGEFVFVNGARMRLDLNNYAAFGHLLSTFGASAVAGLKLEGNAGTRDWMVLLSALAGQEPGTQDERFRALAQRLQQAGVGAFELEQASDDDKEDEHVAEAQQAARRTYAYSVALTKDVMNSVRMGRSPSIKKVKRVVQTIVDQVLNEESSLIGLTALRDYDEYTFTHSVNVCIFSVALGRRLGMSRLQLYEVGLAALLHDIGKSRVPIDVLRKEAALTDDDWRRLMAHSWLGVLALFHLRGQQEVAYRAIVVAHEHHMKCDLSGYPKPVRPRALTMTSRIVAVADGYDAATSRRVYQTEPFPPSAVLQEMRDNPRRGLDPVVVKAFINLLGIYPVGTLVVLDTFELAVVRSASANPDMLGRPHVVIISDASGNLIVPPMSADLSAVGPDGQYARSIIKTADPDRYGVRVSDYII